MPGWITGLLLAGCLLAGCCQVTAAESRTATPREGEGVYALLRRHGFQPTPEDVEAFRQLNQERLGANDALIRGRTYRIPDPQQAAARKPVAGGRVYYPIFGPRYAWVERKNTELAGCALYLESGHGGPDPGALGWRDGHLLAEDEYAYDITLRLARVLLEKGAAVFLIVRDPNDGIRDGQWLVPDHDELTYPRQPVPANQVRRLHQRAAAVNALYEQEHNRHRYHRLVIIHVDSRSQDEKIDTFFYHHANSAAGNRLATHLRDAFEDNYRKHQPERGYRGSVSTRNLYMLRATVPPAAFIELGNIRNPNNQYRFIDPANRQALAEWIADGIERDVRAERDR